MDINSILNIFFSGISLGGCYALIGLGLTIIFGTMRVFNLAHGEFVMLGAYFAYFAFIFTNGLLNQFFSVPIVFLLGWVIGTVLFPLIKKVEGHGRAPYILTFGLSVLIANLALIAWSPTFRGIPFDLGYVNICGISIPIHRYLAAIIGWGLIIAVELFMRKTYLGKSINAVAQDKEASQLIGINVTLAMYVAFALSVALGCVAGGLLTLFSPAIYPYMGAYYRVIASLVGVLGGLGSHKGALVAGAIIGIIESVSQIFVSAAVAPAIPFLILIIVLLVRPKGLFGVR